MAGNDSSVNVYSIGGDVVRTISLPRAFGTVFRPDIIKRAVVAQEANRRQPYGPSKMAGMRHAVSTWGKGRGVSRVQRLTQGRKAAESPNNVGGRRAHPPVPEKDWSKKVNRKERRLAKLSALAATSDPDIVKGRGHQFDDDITLPLIVEDGIESLENTREVIQTLESLGVGGDVDRAKNGKHIRAGKGKMRGRRYRRPRGILIVVSDEDVPLFKSAGNIPGVEIVEPGRLNAGLLAPGGDAGRLALFTEAALGKMGEW
jgi:large subunit ribosomal protein L4e